MMSDKGTADGLTDAREKDTVGGGVPAGGGADDDDDEGGGVAAGGGLEGAAALFWRATLFCRASRSMPCAEATATGIATAESRASFMLFCKGLEK